MRKSSRGFTLVELLIVVSIIAVLAIMGFAAYRGSVARGNDVRRKADINAIANALEANKTSDNLYQAISGNWFSTGSIPIDPKGTAIDSHPAGCGDSNSSDGWGNGCWYCIQNDATTTYYCASNDQNNFLNVTTPFIPGGYGQTGWSVCANLETGTTDKYYCRKNVQ